MPEQFPGSKKAVACIRKQYGKASKKWNVADSGGYRRWKKRICRRVAIIEAEKEELRRAQKEASKHDDVLGLSGEGVSKKERRDEVSRLKASLTWALKQG